MNNRWSLSLIVIGLVLCLPEARSEEAGKRAAMHAIELHERVLCPEDGLLLGNGDLSVSVYQTVDRIVWRFGKNDVWDRRLDLSDDPKPAAISEIARGIRDEGWKCGPYGGPVQATRGAKDQRRMTELCQGSPPSYKHRPYPCPKPVGELALQLPADQMGLRIEQRLVIEEATLRISCIYPSGVRIEIESFIPPSPNALVVRWKVEGWNERTHTGRGVPPVWFSLYRWPDPTIQAFAEKFSGDFRHDAFRRQSSPKATPLLPPSVQREGGLFIEQTFPPDPLFKDGFRFIMAPFAPDVAVGVADMPTTHEARLHLMPKKDAAEGWLAVAVATSSDSGGARQELARLRKSLAEHPSTMIAKWLQANRQKAGEFWSRSRVSIADPLLENLWYETLHARRCTNRPDTPPPGLFLPSTVPDYTHWHGDYHTNYNLQEPFWGDYTANHLELGDAYFQAMKYFLKIGRKIAKDYYNCRGVFVQLTGYPIIAEDDPLGIAPMGRMAYMTGWCANQYWWRYRYTMDKDWLRAEGYPVLRDCALFYTDFMQKGEDGLYHVFPSNQGEDGFSGSAKDYTDRPQVMQHLRYCLRAAVQASEVLGCDGELRAQWRDRLNHCAGDDGRSPVQLEGIARLCHEACPPEFGPGRPFRRQPEKYAGPPAKSPATDWYFGQYPWSVMRSLRAGDFIAERSFPVFRETIERWRHSNGLVWGMAIANYGHAGAWTESLGVIAPLQEMLLQSWDGALRVFPAWPRGVDAGFENLRAEGAFLVTASWSQGEVKTLEILSERGSPCHLYSPWLAGLNVQDAAGSPVQVSSDAFGRLGFLTQPGKRYRIEPAK